jgi:hypothetical protein
MVAVAERDAAAIVCREAYKDVYKTVSGREGSRIVVELAASPISATERFVWGSFTFATATATTVSCVFQTNAPAYDQDFVKSVLAADAAKPEASFNNVVDMLDWLNRD